MGRLDEYFKSISRIAPGSLVKAADEAAKETILSGKEEVTETTLIKAINAQKMF